LVITLVGHKWDGHKSGRGGTSKLHSSHRDKKFYTFLYFKRMTSTEGT